MDNQLITTHRHRTVDSRLGYTAKRSSFDMRDKIRQFFQEWFSMMNPPVFFGAAGIVVGFIAFGGIWTEQARSTFDRTLDFITTHFAAYYIILTFLVLVLVVGLALSPYGRIRLGPADSRPEFSRLAWIAMLFSAGMGMGLVFWGVAEPVMHYQEPPFAAPRSTAARQEALRYSFFHWGFHPWAIYVLFGLGIAYFHFRKELPLAPRSLLYPLIGDRINGPIGDLADIICTVGTLLGVATSLGLGALQINSGFKALINMSFSTNNQLLIILIITAVATTSTVTGVGRGIKYLSMANLGLMFILLVFLLLAGPFFYQMRLFGETFVQNLIQLPRSSLWISSEQGDSWQNNWTVFYWGWWISWCPFVGIFVARISRGRTIREFILYVLLLPSVVTFLWFSVFGGTAFHILQQTGQGEELMEVVRQNESMSLHQLLSYLPLAQVSQWIAVILIIIFFITSSDSGSLVDDMVTSGGHPDPPVAQRAFWGISEGSAAATLILVGGLQALQSASISGGLLQSVLLVTCGISLVLALRQEKV